MYYDIEKLAYIVTAIEYGLIAAFIAIAVIAAFQLLGTNLISTFNNIAWQF